jgi:diguanylate cyclase (GGDEF)-like protein
LTTSLYDSEVEGEPRRYDLRGARIGPDLMVMTWRDVTDRWRERQVLEEHARTDALTGLLNRSAGISRLSQIISYQPRTGTRTAVLFCDIDRFKAINDEFGHAAGDAVLQVLGERIRSTIRSNDVAARIGGDELLVVLTGVRDADDAVAVAEKIRAAAVKPIIVDGAALHTGLSIGVALLEPGESVDAVVARADAAMYAAKRGGADSTEER